MDSGVHKSIPVNSVILDINNPRIKRFLEMYGDNPTPEQMFFSPRLRKP